VRQTWLSRFKKASKRPSYEIVPVKYVITTGRTSSNAAAIRIDDFDRPDLADRVDKTGRIDKIHRIAPGVFIEVHPVAIPDGIGLHEPAELR
jgi:hypothetical protein